MAVITTNNTIAVNEMTRLCIRFKRTRIIKQSAREPVRLFGHSMGGMISTMIANTHPHLVHSLIIGDSPPNNNRSMLKIIRVLMPWWKLIKETAEQKLSVKDTWKYYQKTKPTILSGPAGEPINLLTSAMSFSRTDPEVVVPLIDGFEDHTVFDSWVEGYETREIYPKLRCHVMLIRGNPELGGAIFDDEFEEAKKTIPNLVYVYLPNHGHDLFPSGAEPVGSMINSFLEALR